MYALTVVSTKKYRMKVAAIARPRAFEEPLASLWVTKISYAI
jgi:hypothetical protein